MKKLEFKRIVNNEVFLHLVFWACVSLLPIVVMFTSSENTNANFERGFVVRFLINPLLFYLNYFILIKHFLLKKRIFLYVIISLSAVFFINYIVLNLFTISPFDQLPAEVRARLELPFQKFLKYIAPSIISVMFFLLGGMVAIIKNYYLREEKNKLIEYQKVDTELKFLKTQINPHFLFNSLNSIYALVKNHSKDAPEAVIVLSNMMRYMIYECSKPKVPLKKEIEFLDSYVYLQQLRISDKEKVLYLVDGSIKETTISPLLLVHFIENAFKYGINTIGSTDILIHLNIQNNTLKLIVENEISNRRIESEEHSGIGLTNTRNRLELLYPNAHKLTISQKDNRYYVNLEIKLE